MLYGSDEKLSLKEYFLQKPLWVWILIVISVLVGASIGLFGVYQLVSTNDREIITSNDIENQVCEKTADLGQIMVYISGAVVNPGVYILETGDRVADLLQIAGGVGSNADKVYVHRQFNLAKRLSDGDQFYIPTIDETRDELERSFVAAVGLGISDTTDAVISLISINSSTQDELMELSGIGKVRAGKIIQNRPYSSLEELVSKGVISQSLFEEIKFLVRL